MCLKRNNQFLNHFNYDGHNPSNSASQRKKIVEYFEKNQSVHRSRSYFAKNQELQRIHADFVPLQGSSRVLDIGAGEGLLAKWMAPHSKLYVSIDLSKERLRIAKDHGTSCIVGDGNRLPIKANIIDLVVMRQAFHYFNPECLFDQIKFVCRQNARILISQITSFAEEDLDIFQSLNSTNNLSKRFYSPESLMHKLESLNLDIEKSGPYDVIQKESITTYLRFRNKSIKFETVQNSLNLGLLKKYYQFQIDKSEKTISYARRYFMIVGKLKLN